MPRPAIAYVAAPRHVGNEDGWLQQWLDRLRLFAAAHGFAVTKFYVDDQTTGCAGLLCLTSDLDANVANIVITPNIGHLNRSGGDEGELRQRGARVVEVESPPVLP